jgi:uncharacterized GH25 family protein
MTGRVVHAVLVAMLGSWASSAAAHDTWLLPARFDLPAGGRIVLDLTSGMGFPAPGSSIQPDRLAATGLRIAGRKLPLDAGNPDQTALRLSVRTSGTGVAALWIVTRPRTLSLTSTEVQEYLREIGAAEEVESRWRRQQRWRETYVKLAKTYVRVGQPTADQSWQKPVGLQLEIVPLADPTRLRVGSDFSVQVLRDAKPLPRFSVSALASATNEPIMRSMDGDGRAVFTLDRPGPWLLRGTLIEPASSPDADWQSLFTTLTVRVQPAP